MIYLHEVVDIRLSEIFITECMIFNGEGFATTYRGRDSVLDLGGAAGWNILQFIVTVQSNAWTSNSAIRDILARGQQ